jgi:hypothetical protein
MNFHHNILGCRNERFHALELRSFEIVIETFLHQHVVSTCVLALINAEGTANKT